MATISLQEPVYRGHGDSVFFASGFRPFFLFSALWALVAVPLWLAVNGAVVDLPIRFPAVVWHGHEMVFGFAGAAIGGFLLTAVPNWTDGTTVSGRPLMLLFALWLAGRVVMLTSGLLPLAVVAVVELSYLPVLAVMLAGPLLRARKMRNIAFLPILAALWLCDAWVMAGGAEAVRVAIVVVLVMIAVVGGRIVPSFTANWLRMQGRPVEVRSFAWVEKGGAAASVAVAGLLSVALPDSPVTAAALFAAAAIHGLRLSGWHGLKALGNPLLWVMHLGYAWLVLGLALSGLACLWPALPATAALHALTAGCAATMVIAVMSRAALGHSGRPLEASRLTVLAFVLVSLGALFRVAAPLAGEAVTTVIHVGGCLWALAWLLFAVVHLPIVLRPRADGRPG